MDKKLLAILCCPVTHKGLTMARAEQLKAINHAIQEGQLKNREGELLGDTLKEALITDDGKTLYPIDDGIPVLLEGASVSMEQLD